MKNALITGITGQDGSYLAELLLDKGYNVYGTVRRQSLDENQDKRVKHISSDINWIFADMSDGDSIAKAVELSKPDEIYNLAAMSHVMVSSSVPEFTFKVNTVGVLHILESAKRFSPEARIYQASTSEMFGNSSNADGSQNENTPMIPVSPYGISKLAAYHLIKHYRAGHGLFACNGILMNHESPRRGMNFVSSKICHAVAMIVKGKQDKLELGNIDSYRDWGHAKDYVYAMWMINNHTVADDFVVSTESSYSVRDMLKYVFSKFNMNYEDYVVKNPAFMRPQELTNLKGESSKLRNTFDWKPTYTFETLLDEMVEYFIGIV